MINIDRLTVRINEQTRKAMWQNFKQALKFDETNRNFRENEPLILLSLKFC